MSLESGRKLGLTASIITVAVPVIIVVLYGFLIFSIFATISTTVTGGGNTPFGSFLSLGVISMSFIGLGLLSLIGGILFIVAMYQLSQYYNEPGIFKNIVYSLVVGIAGAGALVAIILIAIFSAISRASTSPTTAASPGLALFEIFSVIGAFLVIGLVSAFFFRRAFNKLGKKSGVPSFDTAGLLILIGVIVPFVSWVSWIFATMGFNSLKPNSPETSTFTNATPQTTSPIITQKRFCPYCGIENTPDSIYCVICGKKLQ
jgi:uncharacterized membrane protein